MILSITCAPQRWVRMACPCQHMFQGSGGGAEVSVHTGTQWGQGGAPSATTTRSPTPSAEVDGVLLWKHGYTQAL